MRIKSNFRDYYDGVQAFGQDDLLYVRMPKEVDDVTFNRRSYVHPYRYKDTYYWKNVKIMFCGKLYNGYKFFGPGFENQPYLYKLEEIEALHKKMGWEFIKTGNEYQRHSIVKDYELLGQSKKNNTPFTCEYKDPIIISFKTEWKDKYFKGKICGRQEVEIALVNGRLSNYNFQTVFDPYSAFQEIRMYLSNLASLEKPIPKIDDVTMAEAKGFDKWSFRKEPSKKGRTRK